MRHQYEKRTEKHFSYKNILKRQIKRYNKVVKKGEKPFLTKGDVAAFEAQIKKLGG